MAIDARARCTSGKPAGLSCRPAPTRTLVLPFPMTRCLGQFVAETDISIGTLPQMHAVDPYVAVGHDAVKLDEDAASGVFFGQGKMLPIPADACRQKAAARRPVGFVAANGPSMLQSCGTSSRSPFRIIKQDGFGARSVSFEKAPAGIKGQYDSRFRRCRRTGYQESKEYHAESQFHGCAFLQSMHACAL